MPNTNGTNSKNIRDNLTSTEYQPLEGRQPPVHFGEKTGFQAVITSPWVMRWAAIPATYSTYRTIRKNSTVALARELAVTPIIASEWTIKADEGVPKEWENYVRDVFMPLRDEYLATALYFGDIDFGYQCWEKIIEPTDGYLKITRLKQLLQDITEICIGHKGGFIGVRQVGQNLGLNNSIHCGFRVEGSYLYGIPLLENIRNIYNMWTDCNEGARRYDRKIAGSHIVVEYPPGSSFDRYGKETENSVLANQILQTLESAGGIAVPRDLAAYMQLLNTQDPGWKIWIMDSGGGHQHSFTDRLEYLDKQYARGLHVPERAMMEGRHGTLAEAEAHGDVIFTIQDIKHRRVTDELNRQAVKQMLYLNFGKEAIKGGHPRVKLVASPIADKQKILFTQLYTQLLGSPAGQQELDSIDLKSMRDQLGIPTHPPIDPGQAAHEQQQQSGQPQLQGIPGVSQGTPGGPGRNMVALDKDGHPVTVDANQPPQQLAQAMANAIEGMSKAIALSSSTIQKLTLSGQNDTEPHKYTCVMADFPEPLRSRCLKLGLTIPNEELDEQGREADPHVTVLYGLHTSNKEDVLEVLKDCRPVEIILGKLKIFPAKGDHRYDVLYVEVRSPDLLKLNKALKSLPYTSKFPKYVPHCCIAYLKPGEGKKYIGRNDLEGEECIVNSLTFSPVEGIKSQIPLELTNMPSNLSGDLSTLPTMSNNFSGSIPELVGQSLDMSSRTSRRHGYLDEFNTWKEVPKNELGRSGWLMPDGSIIGTTFDSLGYNDEMATDHPDAIRLDPERFGLPALFEDPEEDDRIYSEEDATNAVKKGAIRVSESPEKQPIASLQFDHSRYNLGDIARYVISGKLPEVKEYSIRDSEGDPSKEYSINNTDLAGGTVERGISPVDASRRRLFKMDNSAVSEHHKEVRDYELPTRKEWAEAQKIITPQILTQIEAGIENLNLGKSGPQIIGIPGNYAGDVVGLHVAVVDGDWIKIHQNPDYVEGDNCLHSTGIVPKGWVYVDRNVYKHDRDPIAMHEITETLLEKAGWDYEKAHRSANQFEDDRRQKLGIGMSNECEEDLALENPLEEGEENLNSLFNKKIHQLPISNPELRAAADSQIDQPHLGYIATSLRNAGHNPKEIDDATNDIAVEFLRPGGLIDKYDESTGLGYPSYFKAHVSNQVKNLGRKKNLYKKYGQQSTAETPEEDPLLNAPEEKRALPTLEKFNKNVGTEHLDYRSPREEKFINALREHVGKELGELGIRFLEANLTGGRYKNVDIGDAAPWVRKSMPPRLYESIRKFAEKHGDPHFLKGVNEELDKGEDVGTSNELSLAGTLGETLAARGLTSPLRTAGVTGRKPLASTLAGRSVHPRPIGGANFGNKLPASKPVHLSNEIEVEFSFSEDETDLEFT